MILLSFVIFSSALASQSIPFPNGWLPAVKGEFQSANMSLARDAAGVFLKLRRARQIIKITKPEHDRAIIVGIGVHRRERIILDRDGDVTGPANVPEPRPWNVPVQPCRRQGDALKIFCGVGFQWMRSDGHGS